ncbi:MAG: type II toxin-antitoxin system VapC family toxin [Alphaproteobacteria bacterium]
MVDASAILAFLRREPGAEVVVRSLSNAKMSALNLAEVVGWMATHGAEPETVQRIIGDLRLDIVPFDAAAAFDAMLLGVGDKPTGLSLGDRACLALARALQCPALTADPRWLEIDSGAEVRLIR